MPASIVLLQVLRIKQCLVTWAWLVSLSILCYGPRVLLLVEGFSSLFKDKRKIPLRINTYRGSYQFWQRQSKRRKKRDREGSFSWSKLFCNSKEKVGKVGGFWIWRRLHTQVSAIDDSVGVSLTVGLCPYSTPLTGHIIFVCVCVFHVHICQGVPCVWVHAEARDWHWVSCSIPLHIFLRQSLEPGSWLANVF